MPHRSNEQPGDSCRLKPPVRLILPLLTACLSLAVGCTRLSGPSGGLVAPPPATPTQTARPATPRPTFTARPTVKPTQTPAAVALVSAKGAPTEARPTATPTAVPPTATATATLTPVEPTPAPPTATPVPPSPTAACVYALAYVRDVTAPDGTVVEPEAKIIKTWAVKNTGTCAWSEAFMLRPVKGEAMAGEPVRVPSAQPGETVELSVALVAPTAPGRHQGSWGLCHEGGCFQGVVTVEVITRGAEPQPAPQPAQPALPKPAAAQAAPAGQYGRLVLANYFAWYDDNLWSGSRQCCRSNGDKPLQTYNSDDAGATERHINQALQAGIDGFTQQWAQPGDRTDRNFQNLLNKSQGKPFRSTVIFLRHFWGAANQDQVADALRYLLDHYSGHPNFMRLADRPVIMFADMQRVPRAGGQSAQQAWAAIRNRVDPAHHTIWIAEGLDASYLDVFDGLFVYKTTHASWPKDYLKASRWAKQARAKGAGKLWVGTFLPGWDNLRQYCVPSAVVGNPPHKLDRADGAVFRESFDAAVASGPDFLWLNSYNEWVEGTYIEPSEQYGDRYIQLARELIAAYKAR